jgi:hypothetical protein
VSDVASSDLIEPTGPLTPSLFPGEDANKLSDRVDAYIAAAENDTRVIAAIAANPDNEDRATRAYALYRAYSAVVQRMNAEPLSVTAFEKGGHGYSVSQISAMQALADQYSGELDALIPLPTDAATPAQTTSVANAFGW